MALDPLDLRQLERAEGELAVRGDPLGERDLRRVHLRSLHDLAVSARADHPAHPGEHPARRLHAGDAEDRRRHVEVRQRVRDRLGHADRGRRERGDAAREHVERAGGLGHLVLLGGLELAAVRR